MPHRRQHYWNIGQRLAIQSTLPPLAFPHQIYYTKKLEHSLFQYLPSLTNLRAAACQVRHEPQ
ncbi:hypothetical protein L914_15569 [Phytophthora nicotianae]|uniref:Uncharacterized protein n=2 Tax=Phytophthora nicotianae TaxID=4792 RepID=V9EIU3_PHYNI|nr:hypothetical protein F443_16165 [Phytophthora nicotianae P1569]ETL31618.1 hypothetical protein L916_15612 [Phytophthora nicotianae]ETM38016.1 hypothetical protein L914_15569 [Phytophthora nicotianae]